MSVADNIRSIKHDGTEFSGCIGRERFRMRRDNCWHSRHPSIQGMDAIQFISFVSPQAC
jgi:hypothetical protein